MWIMPSWAFLYFLSFTIFYHVQVVDANGITCFIDYLMDRQRFGCMKRCLAAQRIVSTSGVEFNSDTCRLQKYLDNSAACRHVSDGQEVGVQVEDGFVADSYNNLSRYRGGFL